MNVTTIFALISMLFVCINTQAPGDAELSCRIGLRTQRAAHDWIPYVQDITNGVRGQVKWQILLDQWDYHFLITEFDSFPPPVWTARDFDGDGRKLRPTSAICLSRLFSSAFENPDSNNWVFTQAVSYLDAVEVIVNASVRFSGCIQRRGESPPCLNNFVNLHRYDTNSIKTESEVTNTVNYQPYQGDLMASQIGTEEEGNKIVINRFPRPQDSTMTYFGIQDVGTYGFIHRIIVYYRVAQGYEEGLLVCPHVPLPKEGSGRTNSKMCECKAHASATTSLERVCNAEGVCEDTSLMCACDPGYQYNESLQACEEQRE